MSELPNHRLVRFLRRRHFVIAAAGMALIFMVEGVFLYQYFYRSLVATKTLIELREQAALEELKMPLYKQLIKIHEEKQSLPALDPKTLPDPFTTVSPTSSSSSASPR